MSRRPADLRPPLEAAVRGKMTITAANSPPRDPSEMHYSQRPGVKSHSGLSPCHSLGSPSHPEVASRSASRWPRGRHLGISPWTSSGCWHSTLLHWS
ncbi:hypothetical protein E2C01_044220 [Portunus trituberculatus]|uniref:Uncharacterized protein n=1 Tax=Portunus trituberculatus TaxID=210409 RepID=A0A5B7FV14_PORTR|nr:hypothetical protein [Portunus trituberculatus]